MLWMELALKMVCWNMVCGGEEAWVALLAILLHFTCINYPTKCPSLLITYNLHGLLSPHIQSHVWD